MQRLCTLPSKAKRTITEIKSNFSNKGGWGLKTHAQVSDQITAKAEKAEYNFSQKRTSFFPLFQELYLPGTVKGDFSCACFTPLLSTSKN